MTAPLRSTLVAALVASAFPAALVAQDFDRSQVPAAGPTPEVPSPEVHRRTLPNGLELWTVSRHGLPIVNATLVIRAGADADGDLPGLASVTAGLLDEGSTDRSAPAFARAVEGLGISLNVNAGIERTTITLQALTATADSAFALLGELVGRPGFTPDEIDRDRQRRLTALRARQDQPVTVATQLFNAKLYGADAPYGHPGDGTLASIAAITRPDIIAFYGRYYRPANAVLVVVGDVTPDRAAALALGGLGGWEGGAASKDPVPAAPAPGAATVYLVDKPKAAQSEIRIGNVGASRTSPDFYALTVLNTVLGGQFSSRINLNIREAKGYTYGARSSFTFLRGAGPFMASSGVVSAKTDSALVEFMRELKDIRGPRPATPAEVAFGTGSIVRAYPRRLETNAGVANELAELAYFRLPPSELADYQRKIAAVSTADVDRVAKRYLQPEHFVTVVVGDLATLQAGIEALRLGAVRVVDPEGRPLP
ncbi:MAG TPA: pitrilysin family protein [Gemmatimonadales bacterium]|nr:pitrilysin family protein [Gemmatimonadales bacterium]